MSALPERNMQPGCCKQAAQRGSALVEFAFVLPVLIVLVVGIVYYGFVFTLVTALDHAASQGAQVAVSIQPLEYNSTGAYQSAVERAVGQSVGESLDWLPASTPGYTAKVCFSCGGNANQLTKVTVTMQVAGSRSPLLPRVHLPLLGSIPPLPDKLQGVAEVAL